MHDDDVGILLDQLGREHRDRVSTLVAEIVMLRSLLQEAAVPVPTLTGAECLRRVRRAFLALQEAGVADPEQPRELTAAWWDSLPSESLPPDPREPSQLPGAEGL